MGRTSVLWRLSAWRVRVWRQLGLLQRGDADATKILASKVWIQALAGLAIGQVEPAAANADIQFFSAEFDAAGSVTYVSVGGSVAGGSAVRQVHSAMKEVAIPDQSPRLFWLCFARRAHIGTS
jgi:hypothetical protein